MWEKLRNLNLKAMIRAFALVWMLVLIIVMTVTNIGIDKEFNFLKWLGQSMILFGITVFGLFVGESSGIDFQREKKDGRFKRNLKEYETFRASIDSIHIFFSNWYDWWIPQRVERKKIEFLITGGMNAIKAENIVKYCTLDDFFNLKDHAIHLEIDGKSIDIRKLLPKEVEPTEMVLKGEVPFKQSGTAYYLQAFAESNQTDKMEQGEAYKAARKENKRSNRIIRLVGGLVISFAIGILAVGDFMSGGDTQAWFNLVSRIANLFTALLSGYLSGVIDVRLQADSIADKTDVLHMFKSAYDLHLFEIYDENEAARREVEEYNKKIEEAKESVVDNPEILQIEEK